MYDATIFVVKIADGVNDYDGDKFLRTAVFENTWPEFPPMSERNKITTNLKKIYSEGFDQPLEYIKFNKDNGLTHLLIKEGDKKGFFDDIFVNEGNYPFLEKIYDSNDSEKTTKYKIFKINYERLK